jgi:flagellar biosynthesis/type III secretory pathway protein FliH
VRWDQYEEQGRLERVEQRRFGSVPFDLYSPAQVKAFARQHRTNRDGRAAVFRDPDAVRRQFARGLDSEAADQAAERAKKRRARNAQLAGAQEGAQAGIEAGRAKGGRSTTLTPEQQVQITRLVDEGWSDRRIAAEIFGDAGKYGRVYRFRHR